VGVVRVRHVPTCWLIEKAAMGEGKRIFSKISKMDRPLQLKKTFFDRQRQPPCGSFVLGDGRAFLIGVGEMENSSLTCLKHEFLIGDGLHIFFINEVF
jgi:hypothetical protein